MAQPTPINSNYLSRFFPNLRLSHILMMRLKTESSSRSSSQFQEEHFHRISSKWWKKLQKRKRRPRIYFQS